MTIPKNVKLDAARWLGAGATRRQKTPWPLTAHGRKRTWRQWRQGAATMEQAITWALVGWRNTWTVDRTVAATIEMIRWLDTHRASQRALARSRRKHDDKRKRDLKRALDPTPEMPVEIISKRTRQRHAARERQQKAVGEYVKQIMAAYAYKRERRLAKALVHKPEPAMAVEDFEPESVTVIPKPKPKPKPVTVRVMANEAARRAAIEGFKRKGWRA